MVDQAPRAAKVAFGGAAAFLVVKVPTTTTAGRLNELNITSWVGADSLLVVETVGILLARQVDHTVCMSHVAVRS